jgi:DNA helicase-2/ATP-dependent DNA helicase PcrA
LRGEDVAVLFRTNAQSRSFEEAFRKLKIPYVLVGGTGFYERAEIKDCLAYLRLIVNQKDNIGFDRICNVPARGLGEKAREALVTYAMERKCSLLEALLVCDIPSLGNRYQKGFTDLKATFELLIDLEKSDESPHEILLQMLQLSGYMDMLTSEESEDAHGRIENINELVNALAMWSRENEGKRLSNFLEEVSLVSDIDSWDKKESAVNLMTLHCAKGLEFKLVFLVGLEDGILPSRQNFDDESKLEEERRLLYVGATRAMEKLECSHVDQRWRFGDLIPSGPSRFLSSIPGALYAFKDCSNYFGQIPAPQERLRQVGIKPSSPTVESRSSAPKQAAPVYDDFNQDNVEFRMGQHVHHKIYGRGRILSISGFADDMKLTVLFNDGTRKKLMAKFANFDSIS